MSAELLPDELIRYLMRLEAALAGVPREAREDILDDVQAHALDSIEAGRSLDDALSAFGRPEQAAERFREMLGLSGAVPPNAARVRRALLASGAVFAAISGMYAAFVQRGIVLPEWLARNVALTDFDHPVARSVSQSTAVEYFGVGAVLLAFVPLLLALLPFLARQRVRVWTALAAAAVTALIGLAGFHLGGLYVPVAVFMWVAAAVPDSLPSGRAAILWRLLGGALLAAPGLLMLIGSVSGAFSIPAVWLFVPLLFVATGVLFCFGIGWIAYLATGFGAFAALYSLLFWGVLSLGSWWIGSLYLLIGVLSLAVGRTRRLAASPGERHVGGAH